MKNVKKNLLIGISILIIIFFYTMLSYDRYKVYPLIVTFLSITTGFAFTALSIIATSALAKELYNNESENNSLTLLHELVYKFRNSTFIFVLTIALIIFDSTVRKVPVLHLQKYEILPTKLLGSIILYFTILSFYNFALMFNMFSKFVIKTGSQKT